MSNKILTIFAAYDRDNIIDDYVVYYLKELALISDIIYVSDCDIIESEFKKIKDYVIHIINGKHNEYDFGSYKRGFLYAKENNILNNYNNIIFCNDSVYGPFFNIIDSIKKIASFDFAGFYLSKDLKIAEHYYISSFFIIMSNKVFQSSMFYNFINSIQKENDKLDIVKKYEFGLSKLMLDNNIDLNALFFDNNTFNRPYFSPLSLIKEGFPFLKRHCLEKKITVPLNIKELKEIIEIIKNKYNIKLIVNHLNRVADKKQIKYLFQKYKPYTKYFISKNFIYINAKYSPSGKFLISFKILNCINIAFTKSIKKSYTSCSYDNFDFLL